MAEIGVIPKESAEGDLGRRATSPRSTSRGSTRSSAVTKHDVIAFLTHLAEFVGPEARFVHQGHDVARMCSTPASPCSCRARRTFCIADVDALLAALKRRAFEHKYTPTIGRCTASTPSRPPSASSWPQAYAEFARARARLVAAREEIATCAISGAVGTFANIDPRVEDYVARQDGTDRRAGLDPGHPARPPRGVFATLGRRRLVGRAARDRNPASAAHRGAARRRNISRQGQKGSSAMPHKRNPVLTENLTGLARMVRGDGDAGDGERRAVARARHLAFLGRAHDRARRDDHARLRAGAP